jgi:uncharacterized protein (TIGR02147 family)
MLELFLFLSYIENMKKIFTYLNYREYLADFYQEKKQTTRHFSYRFFALRAGIKSPVFLKQVIDGQRNLTRTMIEKFSIALNLNKKESVFFKNLVLFNQAKNANEKQESYSVMLSMMNYVGEQQLSEKYFSYFENWYNSVIRELVCLFDFQDDFQLLAETVNPPITANEAKKAVKLLLELKLLVKQRNGSYRQSDPAIISNDDMVALARRSFNSEMLLLAKNANDRMQKDERNVSGITMGISKNCYDILLAEMAAFKERVKAVVAQDKKSTRVYQLAIQLFPLSKDVAIRNESGDVV